MNKVRYYLDCHVYTSKGIELIYIDTQEFMFVTKWTDASIEANPKCILVNNNVYRVDSIDKCELKNIYTVSLLDKEFLMHPDELTKRMQRSGWELIPF